MNDPGTDVEDAVRSMLERSTRRIEATSQGPAPQHRVAAQPAPMPTARNRRPRLLVAAAACLTLVVAGFVMATNGARAPEQVDTASGQGSNASPSTTAPGTASSTAVPDYYDGVISSIRGPLALPASRPPEVEWVWLSAGSTTDGPPQQDLMVEHGDSGVRVCPRDLCGSADGELIRTLTINGVTFSVIHVSTKNSADPSEIAPLDPAVASYWRTATFTSNRPDWLLPSMEPGTLQAGN